MTVVDFLKEFGWDYAVSLLNDKSWSLNQCVAASQVDDFDELKRYVAAYELIKGYKHLNCGRWHFIADYCSKSQLSSPFDSEVYNMVGGKYDKAIKLVEEVECLY